MTKVQMTFQQVVAMLAISIENGTFEKGLELFKEAVEQDPTEAVNFLEQAVKRDRREELQEKPQSIVGTIGKIMSASDELARKAMEDYPPKEEHAND